MYVLSFMGKFKLPAGMADGFAISCGCCWFFSQGRCMFISCLHYSWGANYGQRLADQLPLDFNSMVFAPVELGMHCYHDLVGLIYIFCEYKCECYAYFRSNRTLHTDIRGWDLSELTLHIGMWKWKKEDFAGSDKVHPKICINSEKKVRNDATINPQNNDSF